MAPCTWGCSSRPPPPTSDAGQLLSSPPLTSDAGHLLLAAPPDLGRGVAPLGRSCIITVWHSLPMPLTSDVGQLLSAATLWAWGPNHDGVITDLEPDILECEVKWALESITTNKASGG